MDNFGEQNNSSVSKRRDNKLYIILAVALIAALVMGMVGGLVGYNIAKSIKESATVSYVSPNITYTGEGKSMGVADVVEQISDSVVEINVRVLTSNGYGTSAGSGVVYTTDGYIVTNNHVVEGASKPSDIKVRLKNGKEYTAESVATDPKTDLAVIKISSEVEEFKPAVLGDSSSVKVGETAIVVGNPLGTLGGSVTDGIVSALHREIVIDDETMVVLQTNAEISPGNSGGGIFDIEGKLIGIVNAKSTAKDAEGIGFAIPIDIVKAVATDLIEYGYVRGRTDTGLDVIEILDSATRFSYYNYTGVFVDRAGVYVLTANSAATANGFMVGDRIVSVNDAEISSKAQYNAALNDFSVGDSVKFVISRGNVLRTINVTLTEYKKS